MNTLTVRITEWVDEWLNDEVNNYNIYVFFLTFNNFVTVTLFFFLFQLAVVFFNINDTWVWVTDVGVVGRKQGSYLRWWVGHLVDAWQRQRKERSYKLTINYAQRFLFHHIYLPSTVKWNVVVNIKTR